MNSRVRESLTYLSPLETHCQESVLNKIFFNEYESLRTKKSHPQVIQKGRIYPISEVNLRSLINEMSLRYKIGSGAADLKLREFQIS
jgi:hypothetical protein